LQALTAELSLKPGKSEKSEREPLIHTLLYENLQIVDWAIVLYFWLGIEKGWWAKRLSMK
jgi:hypothetical protein